MFHVNLSLTCGNERTIVFDVRLFVCPSFHHASLSSVDSLELCISVAGVTYLIPATRTWAETLFFRLTHKLLPPNPLTNQSQPSTPDQSFSSNKPRGTSLTLKLLTICCRCTRNSNRHHKKTTVVRWFKHQQEALPVHHQTTAHQTLLML